MSPDNEQFAFGCSIGRQPVVACAVVHSTSWRDCSMSRLSGLFFGLPWLALILFDLADHLARHSEAPGLLNSLLPNRVSGVIHQRATLTAIKPSVRPQ